MKQIDWIGEPQSGSFKDIRNTRDEIAERKAVLVLLLGRAINSIPRRLMEGGSVDDVRAYKADREKAAKVCANRRSSVQELSSALSLMESHVGTLT